MVTRREAQAKERARLAQRMLPALAPSPRLVAARAAQPAQIPRALVPAAVPVALWRAVAALLLALVALPLALAALQRAAETPARGTSPSRAAQA